MKDKSVDTFIIYVVKIQAIDKTETNTYFIKR